MDENHVVRVAIVDRQAIFRAGLRKLLEADRGFCVIGEAADATEAVKVAREHKPHVLLLDFELPRASGLDVLRELPATSPMTHALLLAGAVEPDELIEALRLGARGLILKESATELLFKGIRAVITGQYWLAREHVAFLVESLRRQEGNGGSRGKNHGLTPRELEIVAAIADGYTNKDIAERFSLSLATVKHHLTNIFEKLGVSTRLELALFALDHRLVRDEVGR